MRIEPLGDSALLVRVAEEFKPEESLACILRATRQLELAKIPGLLGLTPSYTTIAVFFDPAKTGPFDELRSTIERALECTLDSAPFHADANIEVPVCYDSEFAFDLGEVARHAGLSPDEVVRRHSEAHYLVSCVGSTPGYPYLSGLPPELATPRRASPRTDLPAGSVAIGGIQTGIYPRKSPGGWNVIGRTTLRLFDIDRDPPAVFRAGDRVRFRKISRQEFDALSK